MRFQITRVSIPYHRRAVVSPIDGAIKGPRDEPHDDEWYIEIETLEQLKELRRRAQAGLIIWDGGSDNIMIYDDRVE